MPFTTDKEFAALEDVNGELRDVLEMLINAVEAEPSLDGMYSEKLSVAMTAAQVVLAEASL